MHKKFYQDLKLTKKKLWVCWESYEKETFQKPRAPRSIGLFRNIREALQAQLLAAGIPSMIYYPIPAHRQKMFSGFQLDALQLPLTEALCEQVISLPIHTEMDEQQLEYIIAHVLSFFKWKILQ